MLKDALLVFQWMTIISVLLLSLPQLIKVVKEKEAKHVNFFSFWVAHIGIVLWVIYGSLNKSDTWNVIAADGSSLFINGVGMYYLHKYDVNRTSKKFFWANFSILLTFVVAIVFAALHFAIKEFRVSDKVSLIFSLVAPAFTTLAFVPQYIYSIRTKQWQGVSYWMYALYVINNFIWISYWSLLIRKEQLDGNFDLINLYGALTWQSISLVLFSSQLTFTLHDRYFRQKDKYRKKHENNSN